MDGGALSEETERQLHELMTEWGFTRDEAMIVIGLAPGYPIGGGGDLVSFHPLTDAQRQRSGLSHTLDQVMAAQRARQARETAASNGQLPRDNAAGRATEPKGASRSRRAADRRKDG